ncbi:hypothetical protein, partial [Vibrio gallaecicus]
MGAAIIYYKLEFKNIFMKRFLVRSIKRKILFSLVVISMVSIFKINNIDGLDNNEDKITTNFEIENNQPSTD